MRELSRRDFLANAAALPVLGLGAETAVATPRQMELDPVLLRALAQVVLPAELGGAGIETTVVGFERWVGAYEPAAEANHGYGTDEIDYLPPDPAPGWNAQLRALDVEATRRYGSGFAALEAGRRTELVHRHIGDAGPSLPSPLRAAHVAVGLLAWWAGTTEANDLCYRARIGRETCRPLSTAGDPPPPLDAGS
jgi:hypothetical protein